MEKIYKEASGKSGIYQIINKINEKFYIGSCKRFKQRWKEHERALMNNRHHNQKLQRAFNKYGFTAFIFEVLEVVEGDKLQRTTVEQKYLDEIKDWEQCYNIQKKTVQTQGPFSYTTEETKRKMSESHKGLNTWIKGTKLTKEHKEKLSKAHRGEKNHFYGHHHTEETRKKISETNSGKNNGMFGKPSPNHGKAPSEETREKLSKAGKGKLAGNKNPMFGITGLDHPSTKTFYVDLINTETNEVIFGPVEGIQRLSKLLGINPGYFGKFLKGEYSICKNWILHKMNKELT